MKTLGIFPESKIRWPRAVEKLNNFDGTQLACRGAANLYLEASKLVRNPHKAEPDGIMELEPLKVLLIGNDAAFMRAATGALCAADGNITVNVVPTLEAGLARLKELDHYAILYEMAAANTASLFQIKLPAAKVPRLPIIVSGP